MAIYANESRVFTAGRKYCGALILFWLLGLIIGYSFYEPSFLPLMPGAVFQPLSIVGSFLCVFLPLIFSYFAFITDKPIIILIVCFFKAIAFGFSGALITQAFTSAGWLVRCLFMFSDTCFLFVLFNLWFWRFSGGRTRGMADVLACGLIGCLLVIADYFTVSLFAKGLF